MPMGTASIQIIGLLFVSWLTRRMGGGMPGGPPGVMSFGKTKARI
jgi:cell division protease FtsH